MGSLPSPDLPKPWVSTPLIESAALSKAAGCRIFLKLENLQPAASFKSRGIGNLIRRALLTHPTPHLTHFYSSSGGNAGLACVTAAHTLGRPATVVVPMPTKPLMVAKIKNAGATDVIQTGASWAEADAYLREELLAKDKNGVYVPPFDHEDVWDGAATIIEELEEKPDAVKDWGDVKVLTVETAGAESLHKSLAKGERVRLDQITSICTSLGASMVGQKTFEYGQQRQNVRSVVLEDREAVMGCWRLADDERFLVEPACGVNVALCYDGRLAKALPGLTPESKVVIVLCGGAAVTLELLMEWRDRFGLMERETTGDEEVPSTVARNGLVG
ncbi:MAG: catabolic L-serine/threonine dehydratase [Alectoria sarmentosa]|nr:MAG: catabolic L-serine/threonine dehydratase [Alectoria sarmentosa]